MLKNVCQPLFTHKGDIMKKTLEYNYSGGISEKVHRGFNCFCGIISSLDILPFQDCMACGSALQVLAVIIQDVQVNNEL